MYVAKVNKPVWLYVCMYVCVCVRACVCVRVCACVHVCWIGCSQARSSAFITTPRPIQVKGPPIHTIAFCLGRDWSNPAIWYADEIQQQCGLSISAVAIRDSYFTFEVQNELAVQEALDKAIVIKGEVVELLTQRYEVRITFCPRNMTDRNVVEIMSEHGCFIRYPRGVSYCSPEPDDVNVTDGFVMEMLISEQRQLPTYVPYRDRDLNVVSRPC